MVGGCLGWTRLSCNLLRIQARIRLCGDVTVPTIHASVGTTVDSLVHQAQLRGIFSLVCCFPLYL